MQWFLRRIFIKTFTIKSLFRNFLPLKKEYAMYFDILKSSSHKNASYQVQLKLVQWILRKKSKMSKGLQRDKKTDGKTYEQTTDNG